MYSNGQNGYGRMADYYQNGMNYNGQNGFEARGHGQGGYGNGPYGHTGGQPHGQPPHGAPPPPPNHAHAGHHGQFHHQGYHNGYQQYQQHQAQYQPNNYINGNGGYMNGYGMNYGGGQGGYPGPRGDYHSVQKWNSMSSFNNMKAVDWNQVTNLIQVVKNFYKECPSVQARTNEEVVKWREENKVRVVGNSPMKPILSFAEAGLPQYLMKIIQQQKYETPTVIQAQSWPIALSGNDMIGIARTGSGKTLAFCLPAIIHIMAQQDLRSGDGPIALILSPTRELAKQVDEVAKLFGKCCGINSVAVYGGADKNVQISQLNKGAHIVVACPGRLLDLINQKKLNLHRTTYLVMDEADRMLDMGFEPQIRKVVGQIRKDRQTLMFSATWPDSVQKLAHDFMNDPTQIYIGNQGIAANANIKQIVEVITEPEKQNKFLNFFREAHQKGQKILVFTDTKRECDNLAYNLNKMRHRTCAAIHGDKDQRERERVLNDFRHGRVTTLIATDVAARGLDIDDVGYVINYDFPHTVEDYVHRIGRTGRANATGTAYSLITEKHAKCVNDLIKVLEGSGNEVPDDLFKLKPNNRKKNGYSRGGRSNNGNNYGRSNNRNHHMNNGGYNSGNRGNYGRNYGNNGPPRHGMGGGQGRRPMMVNGGKMAGQNGPPPGAQNGPPPPAGPPPGTFQNWNGPPPPAQAPTQAFQNLKI